MMRRDIDILPAPPGVKFLELTFAGPQWLRSALAIAAGIGFAIFLLGLAYSPFGSDGSTSSSSRQR